MLSNVEASKGCVTLIPRHCGVLLCTPHFSGFRKPRSWTFSISLSEPDFSTISLGFSQHFSPLKQPCNHSRWAERGSPEGQKPGLLCTVSSGGSFATTPAHTGRPNRDHTWFNGGRTRPQACLPLCAILMGTGQIFWPFRRMPLSPGAFQTAKALRISKKERQGG
jgi:hypothetical protein